MVTAGLLSSVPTAALLLGGLACALRLAGATSEPTTASASKWTQGETEPVAQLGRGRAGLDAHVILF